MTQKCSYCGEVPAYKPPYVETYVCLDCLYNSKQFDDDFKKAMNEKVAFNTKEDTK